MSIFKKLSIPVLSSILALAPLKAEQISGTVDNVYITNNETKQGELLQGVGIEVDGLGFDITDENGNYSIPQNPVIEPGYDRPVLVNPSSPSLYDALGRRIARLSNDNLEARISPIHLPNGKYFIKDNNNLFARPYGFISEGSFLPIFNFDEYIRNERKRAKESFKNRSMTSMTRRLTASKEGYHDFTINVNIGNSTEYNLFMIPREVKDDTSWAYETTFECFDDLFRLPPLKRDDIPFPVYVYEENIPAGNDSVDYLELLSSSLDSINLGGIWYDTNINILEGDFPEHDSSMYEDFPEEEIERIGKGVLVNFLGSPHGGGYGYNHRIRDPDEIGYDYFFINDIYRWSSRPDQLRDIYLREFMRTIGMHDNAPHRSNYVMAYEWGGIPRIHPQEKKAIKLAYNINQRFSDYLEYVSVITKYSP